MDFGLIFNKHCEVRSRNQTVLFAPHHIKYNLGCSFWVIRHEACIKCEAIKEDVLTFMRVPS